MSQFIRPPSKLGSIAEDSDDNSEEMSIPIIHRRNTDIGSWKDGFDRFEDFKSHRIYFGGNDGPIIFCVHGAGGSGLSFTLLSKSVKSYCRVVAPDLRGHGIINMNLSSIGHTFVENEKDLSSTVLTNEIISLINHVLPDTDENKSIPIILIGHSMGGGIAVQVANDPLISNRIKGLIVIDVVEGTAMESLNVMMSVLKRRPQYFNDYEEAIDWSINTHLIMNRASARISIPDQLVIRNGLMYWRTDLFDTQPYWVGWYENMSQKFLDASAIKMLILAGRERLDKTLMIGQMQGKFQMVLQNGSSHFIHEDVPEEIGQTLYRYLSRYSFLSGSSEQDTLLMRIQRERALLYG